MPRAGRTSLVGRSAVLGTLDDLLDATAAGAGGAALLSGEAGIGKTRVLEECAGRAAARGALVAWGHCTELDGVPPFWAWRDVLAALGVPGAQEGRSGVLAALVDRLDVAAAERPVLLLLEDLHWADADTRWLLRGVVDATAGRSVAVLASWRTAEGGDLLADLPPRVLRIPLAPLPPTEALELAEATADGALPEDALARAAHQSGGNPFFVRELVRMQTGGAAGAERVPHGVRDVLTRRLARLDSATVEVLTAAAVLGADADLPVLAATARRPLEETGELLEHAERAGLVEPSDPTTPVRFVHAVVREVLLDEAGTRPRAALHERAALALEARRPGADEALAVHWSHVAGPEADARTLRSARRARDAARAAAALDQALAFAELAHRRSDDPEDLLVLGDVRARRGDTGPARTELLRAAAAARASGRVDVLARAALALAGGEGGFEVALHDQEQVALLEEADRDLPPGGLRARVRARLAVATYLSADPGTRLRYARSAVREAESVRDERAILHALAGYADMIGGPRHLAERRAVAENMLAVAQRLADVDGELLARRFLLVAQLESGEFAAADAQIEAFDVLARRTHEPAHLWYPPLWRGMRAQLAGRDADAEAGADEAAAIGRRAQSRNAVILAMTLRMATRWGRPDELAELEPPLTEYAADFPPRMPQLLVARASLAAGLRDRAATARFLRPLADARFRSIPEDAEFLSGLIACVEAVAFLEERDAAADLLELLAPHAGLWVVDGIGAACWGVVEEWLALLAGLLGRRDDAARWHDTAERAYRQAGAEGPLRRLTGKADGARDGEALLRREAGGWVVGWAGASAVLPDLKGLRDLATLVSRPGVPVPAVRLLAAGTGVEIAAAGGDEVLDERARSAYRDRLRTLEDEIADAEADADLGRAGRLRDEREFLLRELAAAVGLGGRARRLGDDADRARKAVTMRLRDVVTRLETPMPALARHLRAALRTGRECCYDPEQPVRWRVRTGPPPT
ncbi:ATP-binding protein [Petropleomorpha daqingensis]|uniref:Orc1-like AAA ATPase domain-containing protein n=1 Tax=Petropleomorpha daqingensis TaxID=2026353 RepID=A0A853CK10_9ACTN|nr:AAA family ATPase [Petropleomorpha daqingensis]NYJ07696.1 hypothetical protein [Petropleomorpha daqingensis]